MPGDASEHDGLYVATGAHTIATGSSTQTVLSLSVGESEFYGAVKTACRLLGLQMLLRDMHVEVAARLGTDSSSAKGMASRRGAAGVRHIHTPALWLQQTVARRKLQLFKILGERNTADLGTKIVTAEHMRKLLAKLGIRRADASGLQLQAQFES